MVLAGVELLRFGFGSEVFHLIETAEVPFAAMLSSKSVLPELLPQFVGIYQGGWSRETIRRQVKEGIKVGNHYYQQVQLKNFINKLASLLNQRSYLSSHPVEPYSFRKAFIPKPSMPLTAIRFYECLDSFLDDSMILLSEPGDAFCATPEFHIDKPENFIIQCYYYSKSYCTPAAL